MEFRKYSSIENATRKKTIDYIVETGNSDGEWVSTLKIHGANYSIWSDGEIVKTAKKSAFNSDDKSFYGDFNFDYTENILDMRKYLKSLYEYADVITVCGEIYGGMYNHPDVKRDPGATRVQKEIQYRPENGFIVFDIKVDNILLKHDDVMDLCYVFGFDHVPVLDRGTFKDLLKMPVVFPDMLHLKWDLPTIEKNDAEGWVLKPVEPKFFGNGERIILKGKNPKMCEQNKKERKPIRAVVELSDEGNRLRDELVSFLNENRLRNVLSHGDIEEITQKDFGRLLGLFSKDAFDDFLKDNGEDFEDLPKKEKIVVKKTMNRFAGDVIRPNFLNIIDGEF